MILIDYKDRRPIYEQVVEKLSELMVRGILEQKSRSLNRRRLFSGPLIWELPISIWQTTMAHQILEWQKKILEKKKRQNI